LSFGIEVKRLNKGGRGELTRIRKITEMKKNSDATTIICLLVFVARLISTIPFLSKSLRVGVFSVNVLSSEKLGRCVSLPSSSIPLCLCLPVGLGDSFVVSLSWSFSFSSSSMLCFGVRSDVCISAVECKSPGFVLQISVSPSTTTVSQGKV